DTWLGKDAPGIAAYLVTANTPSMPADRARIMGSIAVPGSAAMQVTPGIEYYSMMIRIRSAKTAGPEACAGCQAAVCLVLGNITLVALNGNTFSINNPLS